MTRAQLSDLSVFVEVVRRGGFRAAAKSLGLSSGAASQAIQRLEDRVGIRLLQRTTRRVSPTDSGRLLYERCGPSITDIESALRDLDGERDVVNGVLRLSAAEVVGPLFLNEMLRKYLLAFPEVAVDVSYDNRKADLVGLGFDAAIRSTSLLEQDTYTLPIGPKISMAIVTSPSYLKARGPIRKPADLTRHDGVCFQLVNSGSRAPWSFDGPDGPYMVAPKPRVTVDDMQSVLELAVGGAGVAYTFAHLAAPYVQDGRLVQLFANSTSKLPRFTINYVGKRHMPPRLRAFLDLAKQVPTRAGRPVRR